MKEKQFKIELLDGIDAIIVIKREGQERIENGDGVVTNVFLHLPSADDRPGCQLHTDIRFSDRCKIFGRDLYPSWGEKSQYGRVESHTFVTKTWADGFKKAEEYGLSEVKKLTDAIAARKQALIDAEEQPEADS